MSIQLLKDNSDVLCKKELSFTKLRSMVQDDEKMEKFLVDLIFSKNVSGNLTFDVSSFPLTQEAIALFDEMMDTVIKFNVNEDDTKDLQKSLRELSNTRNWNISRLFFRKGRLRAVLVNKVKSLCRENYKRMRFNHQRCCKFVHMETCSMNISTKEETLKVVIRPPHDQKLVTAWIYTN